MTTPGSPGPDQAVKDLIEWVLDEAVLRVTSLPGADGWAPSRSTRRALTGDTRLARLLRGVGADDRRLVADEIFDGRPQSVAQATANLGRWAATTRTADDVRRLLRGPIAEIVTASEAAEPAAVEARVRLVTAAVALDVHAGDLDPALAALAGAVREVDANRPLLRPASAVVDLLRQADRRAEAVLLGTHILTAALEEVALLDGVLNLLPSLATLADAVATALSGLEPVPVWRGSPRRDLDEGLIEIAALAAPIDIDAFGETTFWSRLGLAPENGALGVAALLARRGAADRFASLTADDGVHLWILDAIHRASTVGALDVPLALSRALPLAGQPAVRLAIATTGLWAALVQATTLEAALDLPGARPCLVAITDMADAAERPPGTAEVREAASNLRATTLTPGFVKGSAPTLDAAPLLDAVDQLLVGHFTLASRRTTRLGQLRDEPGVVTEILTQLALTVIGPARDGREDDAIALAQRCARRRSAPELLTEALSSVGRDHLPEQTPLAWRRIVPAVAVDGFDGWIDGATTSLATALRSLPPPLRDRRDETSD